MGFSVIILEEFELIVYDSAFRFFTEKFLLLLQNGNSYLPLLNQAFFDDLTRNLGNLKQLTGRFQAQGGRIVDELQGPGFWGFPIHDFDRVSLKR